MKNYNGHRSWNAWNVALWINNDENMYKYTRDIISKFGKVKAVNLLYRELKGHNTPDGAIYNRLCIKLVVDDFEQ